jgi:hypothetical protein
LRFGFTERFHSNNLITIKNQFDFFPGASSIACEIVLIFLGQRRPSAAPLLRNQASVKNCQAICETSRGPPPPPRGRRPLATEEAMNVSDARFKERLRDNL